MSWKEQSSAVGNKDFPFSGRSYSPPPLTVHILAYSGFWVFLIWSLMIKWSERDWMAGGGTTMLAVVLMLFAMQEPFFAPFPFRSKGTDWMLSKDGLHFQNRASIPAAALTRVGGFRGLVVLHFKENGTNACLWLNGVGKPRRLRAALREMIRERKDATV